MSDPAPLPRSLPFLALVAATVFGMAALWLGMDASWDLRNYHYYNGWAALHGMIGRDVLVAQIPSFFNPALDVVFTWTAEHFSARQTAFMLGAAHGVDFALLFAIAWVLQESRKGRQRGWGPFGLAVAGVLGAGVLSELGTAFLDDVVAWGPLTAIWLIARRWDDLADEPLIRVIGTLILAGGAAGLAFGLKQPNVLACVGLCGGFLLADLPLARRIGAAFWFGIGVLAGAALGGGSWMIHLWTAWGNPFFPFFNDLFRSPWGLPIPYRDPGFLQNRLSDMLTLGFRFPFDPELVSEADFRDFRIPVLLLLIPVAAVAGLIRGFNGTYDGQVLVRRGPARWLLVAALLMYGLWVKMFCIYRYLLPLEMLAPLLITAAIGFCGLRERGARTLAVVVVSGLIVTTMPANWLRVAWAEKSVSAEVPPLDQPENTLVVLAGHEPLSFLIPFFPPEVRFLRIDSTFTPTADGTGFPALFAQRIKDHAGPVYSLFIPSEEPDVVVWLAKYGLENDPGGCRDIRSPIEAEPYALCSAHKMADIPASR